jgi:hypothetical protein
MRRWTALALLVAAVADGSTAAQQSASEPGDLEARLGRIGERVQQYYARARTVTATETVRVQSLGYDMSPVGQMRQLVYELRIAWEPSLDQNTPLEASVLRQLLSVNGRAPRPTDEAGCMDPKAVSPEALSMLLPHNHRDYAFKWIGSGRTRGRPSMMIDYRSVSAEPAQITWTDECVSVSLPGRSRGRVWIDPSTYDILRLDEHLTGMFEFSVPREHRISGGPLSMIIERADSSIHYRPVTFQDPDETLMLPSSIETLVGWRNAGAARVRTTQSFSNYKRFVTEGRIVEDPARR